MYTLEIVDIPENAPEMEFKFLVGDVNWEDYGGKWISPKLNNGDFDYWLVIEFINFLDATGETYNGNEFYASIEAVAPSEVSDKEMKSALESCGWEGYDPSDKEMTVEILSSYGISAHLWDDSSNDAETLLKMAKQAARIISGLFGFFMDSPQNGFGSTGWDLIAGDLLAGLNRID